MSFTAHMQCTSANGATRWLTFAQPRALIEARQPGDVRSALFAVEDALQAGRHVAGFLTYEAAQGIDPVLATHEGTALPLLSFGVYDAYAIQDKLPDAAGSFTVGDWTPSISQESYRSALAAIRHWIAAGDTYQVNLTMRLNAHFDGDPLAWFRTLHATQRPRYGAYMDWGNDVLCSVSPELFFLLNGDAITCRPMKGTARRGMTWADDVAEAARLHDSLKNRAENVMIVDMMRNDLGRVAHAGSVVVDSLFDIERYPTVLQMTSTVRGRTAAPFHELMSALFPSCSITGAPKVRTMEIIRELEDRPRGIYTGSIGFLLSEHPDTRVKQRFGQFNVAIRTAHIRRPEQTIEYGTGGGIVWDSEADEEYQEGLTKALILTQRPRTFALLETLCWKPGTGIALLNEHMDRLQASARYFDRPFDRDALLERLHRAARGLPPQRHRARLLLEEDGSSTIAFTPMTKPHPRLRWRLALDDRPTPKDHVMLYHKTTERSVYNEARARFPDADDVLLWNEAGELTESCVANLILQIDGRWHTPPVSSGLLNGTLRAALVRRGRLHERVLTRDDLNRATRIGLINSVRGFIDVVVLPPA